MAQPYVAVPEEALRRRAEISSGAFDLYGVYCKYRNRGSGRCDPSLPLLAEDLGLTYKHVSDLKSELVKKGWIARLGRSAVDVLVGFKPPKVVEITRANSGKNPEFSSVGAVANSGKIRNRIPEKSGIGSASPYSEPLNEPYDDDATSSAAILDFYSEQTGNQPRASDRRTAAELSRHPLHQVKCGIALSVLRARTRINSLAYCVGAVEEMVESGAGEEYLRYVLGHVERRRKQVQPALPGVGAEVAEGNFGDSVETDTARVKGGRQ